VNNKILNLRWLRWTSLAEVATLIFLVCLALQLKCMADMSELVSSWLVWFRGRHGSHRRSPHVNIRND